MCAIELHKLLPYLAAVELAVDASRPVVVIRVGRRSAPAMCTGCGAESDWEHSRYIRRLADAALGDRPVPIDLSVRRLYCENPACLKVRSRLGQGEPPEGAQQRDQDVGTLVGDGDKDQGRHGQDDQDAQGR